MQSKYRIVAPHASGSGSEATGDLGQGAYGVVYKALDTTTNTLVALKKMKVETQVDGISSSTLREITFLRQLKHENVVVLRDVELQNAGRISLIFDLEDGDLSKLLATSSEPFPEETVRSYGAQIMAAISYCHSMGVMHRDLKPQNILVSKEGRLKLADFGLARAIPPYPRPLTVEVITLWYRAPEVLLGHKYYDPSVDVWSAACIICEMSNRRVLFRGFKSDIDQIHTVFRLLGTPTPEVWPGLEDVPYWRQTFPDWPARPVAALVPLMNPDGVDFVSRILRYDAKSRLSARAALNHPYLRTHAQLQAGASSSRAARVTPLAAQSGAYSMVQAQAGLTGGHAPFGAMASMARVEVPVVSLFESGAALASRCSSAVSFQLEDSQLSAPALSQQSDESAALFQPIRSTSDLSAVAAAAPTLMGVSSTSASAELPAPKPLARSASASSSNSSGSGSSTAPVLPRASRPAKPSVAVAAQVTSAMAAPSSLRSRDQLCAPLAATASRSAGNVGEGSTAEAPLVSLPIPAAALTRVQVPVHSVRGSTKAGSGTAAAAAAAAAAAPANAITSTSTATMSSTTASRIRPSAVTAASSAATAGTSTTATSSSTTTATTASRRSARVVTDECAAATTLMEPPTKIARLSKGPSTDSLVTADGGRTRCSSTDSLASNVSVLNTVLERDLDSSIDWAAEDSQDSVPLLGVGITSSQGSNSTVGSTAAAAATAVAAAQVNGGKGRFNKRKFGSPLPTSRPPSSMLFSAPPAAEAPAAAVVTGSRGRGNSTVGSSSASQNSSHASKLVRVTPDTLTSASAVSSELYWAGDSLGSPPVAPVEPVKTTSTVLSKAAKNVKATAIAATNKTAAVAKENVAAAAPARRSTRRST